MKPTCGLADGSCCVLESMRACTTTEVLDPRTPLRTVAEKSADERSRADRLNTCLLDRQLGASLATASRQDGAAGAGAHPGAETVGASTTTVARLKSSLGHENTPILICGHCWWLRFLVYSSCYRIVPSLDGGPPNPNKRRLGNVTPLNPLTSKWPANQNGSKRRITAQSSRHAGLDQVFFATSCGAWSGQLVSEI